MHTTGSLGCGVVQRRLVHVHSGGRYPTCHLPSKALDKRYGVAPGSPTNPDRLSGTIRVLPIRRILLYRCKHPLGDVADHLRRSQVRHWFDIGPRIAEGHLRKGALTCGYVVAGAGFEPATFGL